MDTTRNDPDEFFEYPPCIVIHEQEGPFHVDSGTSTQFLFLHILDFDGLVAMPNEVADRLMLRSLKRLVMKYPGHVLTATHWLPFQQKWPMTCKYLTDVGFKVSYAALLEPLIQEVRNKGKKSTSG